MDTTILSSALNKTLIRRLVCVSSTLFNKSSNLKFEKNISNDNINLS